MERKTKENHPRGERLLSNFGNPQLSSANRSSNIQSDQGREGFEAHPRQAHAPKARIGEGRRAQNLKADIPGVPEVRRELIWAT